MTDPSVLAFEQIMEGARAEGAEQIILTGAAGPSPFDLCTYRRLRRALRRVYTRAEADRLWRAQTAVGLDRPAVFWDPDALFPVALLGPEWRAHVRRRLGWSRRVFNTRLRAWEREVRQRPTARVPQAAD